MKGSKISLAAPIGWGPTALFFAGQPVAGVAMWGGLRALDAMSNPINSLKTMVGAENFLNAHGSKIAGAVGKFSKGASDTVRRATHAKRSDREKKFEKIYVETTSKSPEMVHQEVVEGMPDHVMPDTALTAADTAARGHLLLTTSMPVSDLRPHIQGEPPTISKAEQATVLENRKLMEDPQGYIMKGLNDGTLSVESVAFGDRYAANSMQELRHMVLDDLEELDSQDKLLPFQKRLTLEKLIPSQFVAQTNLQYMQEMASAYTAGQQNAQNAQPQSAKRGESMEIAEAYEQGSQRTERGTHKA
jgi:hypothetical protein